MYRSSSGPSPGHCRHFFSCSMNSYKDRMKLRSLSVVRMSAVKRELRDICASDVVLYDDIFRLTFRLASLLPTISRESSRRRGYRESAPGKCCF